MAKPTQKKPSARAEPISRAVVEAFAEKHQTEGPTAEQVLWLSRILRAFTASPVGKDFALMGGSAIVFLHRDMYRLSTDLDLDFIGDWELGKRGQREVTSRMDRDRSALERIASGLDIQCKPRGKADGRFVQYAMVYPSHYRRTDSVELDMSYRYGHAVLDPIQLPWPVSEDGGESKFKVNTLCMEELYAAKAIAMIEVKERLDFPKEIGLFAKRKIRHLFDLCLLAQDVFGRKRVLDTKLFRDLFLLFGMTRIRNFEYFRGDAIGSYTDADVDAELRSVVPSEFPVPSVDEMKWTVRKFLDKHVFAFTDREHRFMEDFRAGNFRPDDLFGKNSKIAGRLSNTHYYKEILKKVATLGTSNPARISSSN